MYLSDKEEMIALRDKSAFLWEMISTNLTGTQLYSSIDLILLIEQIERLTKLLVCIIFFFSIEKITKKIYCFSFQTSHFDSLTQWYSSSDESLYLGDVNATLQVHRYLVEAISNLVDERYASLWINTNPLGNDFVRLVTSLQRLTMILSQVLINNCDQFPGCSFTVSTKNINQTVKVLNRQELNTYSYEDENTQIKFGVTYTKKTQYNNRTMLINDDKNTSKHY